MPVDPTPVLAAADWLAAAITAHQFGGPAVNQRISAAVSFEPADEAESLSTLRCKVYPGPTQIKLGRAADPHTFHCLVSLKKLNATDADVRATCAVGTLLLDAIRSGLFPRTVAVAGGGSVELPDGVQVADLDAGYGWEPSALAASMIFVWHVNVEFMGIYDRVAV